MRHIAFIGRAGSGKTTLAQMLSEHHGYDRISIAEPIREIALMAHGRFDKAMKYPINTIGEANLITGRELLQEIGGAMRDMDNLFWMRVWRRRANCEQADGTIGLGATRPWVTDDVRLDHEAAFIRAWYPNALFVRLARTVAGEVEAWQSDITERQPGEIAAELVLDTGHLTPSECLREILEAAGLEDEA